MSARLLKKESEAIARAGTPADTDAHAAKSRTGFYGRIDAIYGRSLEFAMRHRLMTAGVAVAVMLSAIPLYKVVKQEYIPSDVDEAEFEVRVSAPLNASLAAMDDVMRRIDADLRRIRGVRTVLVQAGGNSISGLSTGQAFVTIAPHEERIFSIGRLIRETLSGTPWQAFRGNYSQRDVMQEVRRVVKKYPDLRVSVRNAPSFNIGGGNFDIDLAIQGPDLAALERYTEELRVRSTKLGGIVDADTTLKLDRSELRVQIDRERAADLGVRTEDIATALRLMVGGDDQVSRFRDEAANENYEVQLRLVESDRDRESAINRLYVQRNPALATGSSNAAAPSLVRLDNVIRIDEAKSPSRIDRLDRQRVANLRAAVAPGYALADRLTALRGAIRDMDLPLAYNASVRGRGAELERTFTEFIAAFALSILLMYMILASQFESLLHPLTILLALPLSVPFAFLSLWATGNTLNLYSALGLLVLFGIVKKNSILQVDHMNKLRAEGMPRAKAILLANHDRLRPILMTTLALVAGMLPLWVGTGPGAEERRTIAVVVIGGQSLSLFLTLILTPVAYSLFDDLKESERAKRISASVASAFARAGALLRRRSRRAA
jgi:HAE1 family hydrophobic/amphiphilic exporter-1